MSRSIRPEATTNLAIRQAFRKRLLPMVEQCLRGRGTQTAIHHNRKELSRHAAAEILACMQGSWLSHMEVGDLLIVWLEWTADCQSHDQPPEVSIGNFCRYLYEMQIEKDEHYLSYCSGGDGSGSGEGEPKPSRSEQQEKRLYILAMLFVGGYVERFEPELVEV